MSRLRPISNLPKIAHPDFPFVPVSTTSRHLDLDPVMSKIHDFDDHEEQHNRKRPASSRRQNILISILILLCLLQLWTTGLNPFSTLVRSSEIPSVRTAFEQAKITCERLHVLPGVPKSFKHRKESDRYVPGTRPVLIRNATIWTGNLNGNEQYSGDVYLDRGLISSISRRPIDIGSLPEDTILFEANGAFLTPGIVDMHSHLTVDASPSLAGADDTNSLVAPVLPYLRSLDGQNTHDIALKRSISGGVTTSIILPGSANNIGGQAFAIKLRSTIENTPESKVLELPYNIKSAAVWKRGDPPRWRHMKMACGENIARVYHLTRMDESYNFRSAFTKAKAIKLAQNEFCERVEVATKQGNVLKEKFPEELEFEALVDVLRGKVSIATHCYETTDLAAFVRHTNEFEFPLAAFHHAHEAYLVPDLLKSAWNSTPAVAIFATNARYKREAYRGTEYAAAILSAANITVIMKSDHPVLDSRYLLFEAAQAHAFGLPAPLALASVTSAPATTVNFGHRIGFIRQNYDADLVLWDSHPLQLGATPLQVYIDGIGQLDVAFSAKPPASNPLPPPVASRPKSPITLRDDDDVLYPVKANRRVDRVVFLNVREVVLKAGWPVNTLTCANRTELFNVRVIDGKLECDEAGSFAADDEETIDLKGGALLPPLTSFGTSLGLVEISAEKSTANGNVFDPFTTPASSPFPSSFSELAVDGLSLQGKNLELARSVGVGKAVTAPVGKGFYQGVSVAFDTGAKHVLEPGAIIKRLVAVHVAISSDQKPSVSSQIAQLRRELLSAVSLRDNTSPDSKAKEYADENYFIRVVKGELPLVIDVSKADHIAILINLKAEVEAAGARIRMILSGAQEAHLLATELAASKIGVIIVPRSFPASWDRRRSAPGPPLTEASAAVILHRAGVNVGFRSQEEWEPRLLLLEAAWASLNSNGEIDHALAIMCISTTLEQMFGIGKEQNDDDPFEFVAYENDPFEMGSRAVAMSSGRAIELME